MENNIKEVLLRIRRLLSEVIMSTKKGPIRQDVISDKIYSMIKIYPEINRLLDSTSRIWLGSDWHLWNIGNYENDFKNQIIDNQIKTVRPNDVFIYLGDMAHRLSEQKDLGKLLKNTIKRLNGKKIMVLGNHDIFDADFYRGAGFLHVNDGFVWKDLAFTHVPINVSRLRRVNFNIHGHTHSWDYNLRSDSRNIVVYTRFFRNMPVLLSTLLNQRVDKGYKR